jgi:alkylation response protein AidB-like acyl-CoA dehydrogenase
MNAAYGVGPSSQKFVQTAASLAQEVIARHAQQVDEQARFPSENVAALGKAGLLGLCVPQAQGGSGEGPRTFAAVAETLAQSCASTAMIYVMHVSAAQAVAAAPALAGRDELLKKIAQGEHLTTLSLSEKGSRSQFWAPVSKLAEAGDGYTTQAHKSWVTSASHADSYVSSAQKPSAASPLESTIYLVRKGASGVRVASRFDGLGLRGNDSAPVSIEQLKVAKGDLMSEVGGGAKVMLEVILPWFALGTAAMANGLSLAAQAATSQHLQGAGFEHTGQKLRELPNLRARLAQMSIRTAQARALLRDALDEVESASPSAPLYVLQSRASSLDAALEVTDLAMKACGGAAFSKHLPIERLFRDARAGWVMAPTVDHLHDFIGKALTGLPLF